MKNLFELLKKYRGKKLLLIFPHPDDGAYVAGGLLQMAQDLSIKTKLICLTKGGRGLTPKDPLKTAKLKELRMQELDRSCDILSVDEKVVWDFPDTKLHKSKNEWLPILKDEINKSNSPVVVTFDQSGITGHHDHLILTQVVIDICKDLKNRPDLILRVPDTQERVFFKNNQAMIYAQEATHELCYDFKATIKKIKAIYAHKSQLINVFFMMRILEWYLFDHRELYNHYDYKNNFRYDIVLK